MRHVYNTKLSRWRNGRQRQQVFFSLSLGSARALARFETAITYYSRMWIFWITSSSLFAPSLSHSSVLGPGDIRFNIYLGLLFVIIHYYYNLSIDVINSSLLLLFFFFRSVKNAFGRVPSEMCATTIIADIVLLLFFVCLWLHMWNNFHKRHGAINRLRFFFLPHIIKSKKLNKFHQSVQVTLFQGASVCCKRCSKNKWQYKERKLSGRKKKEKNLMREKKERERVRERESEKEKKMLKHMRTPIAENR